MKQEGRLGAVVGVATVAKTTAVQTKHRTPQIPTTKGKKERERSCPSAITVKNRGTRESMGEVMGVCPAFHPVTAGIGSSSTHDPEG
ncbi:hypothetical protein AOLI_G00302000 [Acnodon oligacanthus]